MNAIKRANVALARVALRYAEEEDRKLVKDAEYLVKAHYCDTVEHALEVLRDRTR